MARRSTRKRAKGDDTPKRRETDDEKFLRIARKRFQQSEDADKDQLEREIEALRFAAGEEWPEDIKIMRQGQDAANGLPAVPAKPCITLRKVLDPINQLSGDATDSDFGFELVPADDFGELVGPIPDQEIKLREGLSRRIQRAPESQDAFIWGFDRGMKCGRGYWSVMTRYADGKTNDQDIYIDRIYNQNSVRIDPSHESPDGADAEWGFIGNDVPWDEYELEYPEDADGKPNQVLDADDDAFRGLGDECPGWYTYDEDNETRYCRVVDYYYTDKVARKLATLKDGSVEWEDELPDGTKPVSVRTVIEKQIKWAKIDGKSVLDRTDWPSPYIPIVKYVGRELQPYDEKHRYEGIVQPAIESARGLDYMVSALVWQIGLAPVPQMMMAGGQDEGWEQEYKAMTTRSLPVLHYNQTDLSGRPAPPPFDPPRNSEIGPISAAIAMFEQAIQSATESHGTSHGAPDPALRSGKAIDAVTENDRHGSSNYIKNLARSIQHTGRIVNSLLYPIYGTRPGRITRILDGSGNQEAIMLGKPFTMQGQGKMARPVAAASENAPNARTFTLTQDAKFNCVVKVTKNFDTRRQEEASILGQIISADPQSTLPVIGDLFFANQDGPGHEEIAERYKVMLAPPVQQMLAGKAQGLDIPPQVHAQITQLQQQIQQQGAVLQKAQGLLQNETIKNQTILQKAKMDIDKDIQLAHINNAAKIEVARITAAKQAPDTGAEAKEELLAAGIDDAQENFAAERDNTHEALMAVLEHKLDSANSAQDHAQTMAEGEQANQHAMIQGQQDNANAMAQTQQQAALQPPQAPATQEGYGHGV